MQWTILFNIVSFSASFAAFIFLITIGKHAFRREIRFFILALLILNQFHAVNNTAAWSYVSEGFDPHEELLEVIIPMWWAFVLYALLQDATKNMLTRNENRYRNVFENTQTAMVIVEQDMTISMANSEVERLSGYGKQEIEGKLKWTVFVSPNDLDRMKQYHLNRRQESRDVPTEYAFTMIDKAGNTKDILLKVGMIPGSLKSIASMTDITPIKQAEYALRESEERYRQLFEMESDAIFLIENASGVILEVNPAATELYGYSREELLKMDHTQVSAQPDQTRHATISHRKNVLVRYHRKKDGTVFPVEITARHFSYKNREVHVAAIRDITFRIQAEEEKRKLELQIQKAQRLESLGTLAGGIAHDFNNLLMSIQGNASLMLLNVKEDHPEYDRLKNIEKYVQDGADLTRQLLGFTRGGKYEVKPTNLNDILKQSSDMFGRTKKEITIHQGLQPDIWTVSVDQGQIQQVLLNLYVNAWQAMPAGGDLCLKTKNISVDARAGARLDIKPGNYVEITVADTGSGIDEAIIDKIFDPFFTTKEMGRGTGLGLSSAYGIIRNHDGGIQVTSRKEKGASFKIYLPASQQIIASEPPTE